MRLLYSRKGQAHDGKSATAIKRRGLTAGQAALSEYMIILFIVIGAVTAISTFVRRAYQARIHDARNYMINQVNSACDVNCQAATGNVGYEYEPYYTKTSAGIEQNSVMADTMTNGAREGIYRHLLNEATATSYSDSQLPVECLGPVSTRPDCCRSNPPNC